MFCYYCRTGAVRINCFLSNCIGLLNLHIIESNIKILHFIVESCAKKIQQKKRSKILEHAN